MTATLARPVRTLALPRWLGRHKALVAFCALVGTFYLWTVWSSGSPFQLGKDRSDYYNLLSDGFLAGHLHLALAPSPDLLALPNPYDPAQNVPYAVHDLSLYHDKYYLYWGPIPALLLFMPFRLLPLGDLPETLAVFLFAFVGFCFSLASLRLLARRFVPDAPRWMLGAAALALAAGNALPFTLRRVAIYESAITAGYCFSFIALYLVLTGLRDDVRPRRLALASLFVGFAVGSRPTMAVWGLGLLVIAVILWRRLPDRRERVRTAGALLGPVAAIGVLLLWYNVARFGSPMDFGQGYQLAGYDPHTKHGNKVGYIPPGLWYYLLARPHLTLGFPYVHLAPPPFSYPFDPPAEYDGLEPVGGMLTTVPFIAFALAAPAVLRGAGRRVAGALLAVGVLILLMVCFALWGATMRYEVDFASVLLIVAALGWIGWAVRLTGARRRLVTVGGGLLLAWGVVVGIAINMTGYYDGLRAFSPKTYARLENLTSPLPTLIAHLDGKPKATNIYAPTGLESNTDPNQGVGSVTFPLGQVPVVLTVVSGSPRRYGLQLIGAPQQAPPKGTTITIANADTHARFTVPPTFGARIYPIALRRGLNRIAFRVDQPSAVARLADVHLVPLPGG